MACFLAPMGEAIATTVVQKKVVEEKEKKVSEDKASKTRLSWSRKLSWLNKLLWGGTILLAFEHIWHGEVVLWPPFLTAMKNPADIGPMLYELGTIGVSMAVFVTLVWAIVVMIAELKIKALPETEVKPANRGGV